MSPRWGAGVLLAAALLLGACGAAPREEEVAEAPVYDLRDYLGVGTGEPPLASGERGFQQAVGATSTWHFALPPQAVVRGRARFVAEGAGDTPGPVAVSISLRLARGPEQNVLDHTLREPNDRVDFETELMTRRMDMGALEVAVRGAAPLAPDTQARVVWDFLEIGSLAATPAEPEAPLSARGRNVLVVLFDTLRADHTEPYGSKQVATPSIARLAASGTTFANAFANASWTAPSVASLFTSTYPSLHAVQGTALFHGLDTDAGLSPSLPSLPALLRDAGYATVAMINNPVIAAGFGFERGFDVVHEFWRERAEIQAGFPSPEAQADRVWDRYLAPVLRARGSRPFFAYLHEIDPHAPYEAPPPYSTRYGDHPGVDPSRFDTLKLAEYYKIDTRILSPREVRWLLAQYAAEVTFMDAYLGRLLERLEKEGLREDTLLVFVSDHGESLTDHGRLYHGDTLFDEILRVPLVFSLPGVLPEGARAERPVELVDVAPTLLALLGLERPPLMQGRSLVPVFAGIDAGAPRPSFAQARFKGRFRLDSVRYGRYKLIRRSSPEDGSLLRLFDVAGDPGERRDRFGQSPIVDATLAQMLDWRLQRDRERGRPLAAVVLPERAEPQEPPQLDAQRRAVLQALGYLE